MRSFKEQNKIAWNEAKYKKTLSEDELKVYKSLDRLTKDTLVIEYLKGNTFDILNESSMKKIDALTYEANKDEIDRKKQKEQNKIAKSNETEEDKLVRFFNTQGINNPTNATLNAFKKQKIMANYDNFYHTLGMFTLNMEKQAKYNYYMSQQKQNFIQIAQLDILIKQNNDSLNQNHEILKQNEQIIELLTQIANK
ncbi:MULTISPECIES: hypothetical protein [Staphylococcus]|uniref:hypothetical protein n=1 Tax=Staphylococcus TaxID=1279 RepID=UPI00045B9B02|nr:MULTISPECIES: hypothetical protein [Staphylococcus]KAK56889.1 hypothetical protein SLVCU150_1422 [Staphylococcus lugdunensis VCU150]MCI2814239.1 hypothetical protein [Staphylococcus lugdunensis]MCI2844316.1 hypothetical protein [Staphylococcus lugdunensis]MDU0967457.1 hypothetical protein [Staphylococcus lugdunensis]MDU0995872.1 hypothetical protein [Staphylococcus lugdunensis]